MTTPNKAIIKCQEREIIGMDAAGSYVFADGDKLTLVPLNQTIHRSDTLMKMSELRFKDDRWLIDGEDWASCYAGCLMTWRKSSEHHTQKRNVEALKQALDGLSPSDRATTNGVAWFNERFEPIEGCAAVPPIEKKYAVGKKLLKGKFFGREAEPPAKEFTPFLLSDFDIIHQPINERLAMDPPKSKTIARFDNDYTVAIIPQTNGDEKSLTIETELRDLIKKVIAANGNLPRTKLRSEKTDAYQPEKLLTSKTAKAIIEAKLLGTNKSGRTTVFWAKHSAA